MAGDARNKTFLKKALRGVRTIICPSVSDSMASGCKVFHSVDDCKKASMSPTCRSKADFRVFYVSFQYLTEWT